jgi:crotonobetainyl-CoA:carnitine CoA-transferase CaiB-like acyl-CoA transferase
VIRTAQRQTTAALPLSGLRVIDTTAVMAGPFATHHLANSGADVIKVESPSGDNMRHSGPAPQPGMSPIFQHMNRNKRSIVLDLKKPAGIEVLMDLVRDADVFVYNMRPKALARLGLGYERLAAVNERLIHCGIVGFGQAGPYAGRPAYDDLIQGIAGIPDIVGRANNGEPRYVPFAICDRIAGLYATNAILTALVECGRTGKGAEIQVPMFEANVHFLMVEHLFGASFNPPVGTALNPRMIEPNRRPYPTRDGYLCVMPHTTGHWQSFFQLIGREDLKADARFADLSSRRINTDVLYGLLAEALTQRTTAEWMAALVTADIPVTPMNSATDLTEDPHLAASGFFRWMTQQGGDFLQMATPAQWIARAPIDPLPAPALAQHTDEVLREMGYDEARIQKLREAGVTAAN